MAEFFQNVWSLLTTENAEIIKLVVIPLTYLENIVTILLFSAVLKIKSSKKQKVFFVFSFSTCALLVNNFLPPFVAPFINILAFVFLTKFILNTTFIKAIIAQLLTYFIFIAFGIISINIFTLIFQVPANSIGTVPLYKICSCLVQYIIIYLIYKYANKNNLNITLLDNMNRKNNTILIVNFVIGIIAIGFQSFIIAQFKEQLPLPVNIASLFILIFYFVANLYNLSRTTKLEKTEQDLEEEKAYNKTITVMYDNIRAFRHDFNNIVQAIGRFYCHRRYQRS